MKKRILSLALALTIALSCAPFAGAAGKENAAYAKKVASLIEEYGLAEYIARENDYGVSVLYCGDMTGDNHEELLVFWSSELDGTDMNNIAVYGYQNGTIKTLYSYSDMNLNVLELTVFRLSNNMGGFSYAFSRFPFLPPASLMWNGAAFVHKEDSYSRIETLFSISEFSNPCYSIKDTDYNSIYSWLEAMSAGVQPSSWAKAEVEAADKAGLIPELTGDPGWQDASTRLQFCQLAVQLAETALGQTLPAAPANTFTDCSDLAVRKAYAAGIVNGMTETTFSPNGTLTREQLATMLWRAVNYIQTQSGEQALTSGGSLTGYADAGSVSSYAKEAVAALNKHGIMKGTSNTALSPKGSCTVEQSVLLSYRTFLKF